MTTRRECLQGALALTGLALGGVAWAQTPPILRAPPGATGSMNFHTVVYEPGIAASADFGAAVARRGVATRAIDGDITDLWTGELADLWRQQPVAIAGMTSYPALFLLERFGWDHGLRVVFRVEHKADANGRILHGLQGSPTLLRLFEADLSQRPRFSDCMATLLAHCPAEPEQPSTTSLVTSTFPTASEMPTLYSWIIAPRARQDGDKPRAHAFERMTS